jgi:hypothetical protein
MGGFFQMNDKVLLGIIDNKRPDCLDATIQSLEDNLFCDFFKKVIIDDSGDSEYSKYLEEKYSDRYEIYSHPVNMGLSGSIRTLWNIATIYDVDYIWHQEGDFIFNEKIDVNVLKYKLNNKKTLAQVALKRQAINDQEISVGGFMYQDPTSYEPYIHDNVKWLEHRNFFTLNPCLYPKWVFNLGWQVGWGEKEFSELLFSDPYAKCAYLGHMQDPPLVDHIGHYRGDGWRV